MKNFEQPSDRFSWKGLESEREYHNEINFSRNELAKKARIPDRGLDMTPMVDVTFLLLIFFMVTASFTLSRAFQNPSAELPTEFPVLRVEDQTLVVSIDQNNTFHILAGDTLSVCASDNQMRRQMKDAVSDQSFNKLIIEHHGDATHEKVVAAWDAGTSNNINRIVTHMTEVNF